MSHINIVPDIVYFINIYWRDIIRNGIALQSKFKYQPTKRKWSFWIFFIAWQQIKIVAILVLSLI